MRVDEGSPIGIFPENVFGPFQHVIRSVAFEMEPEKLGTIHFKRLIAVGIVLCLPAIPVLVFEE